MLPNLNLTLLYLGLIFILHSHRANLDARIDVPFRVRELLQAQVVLHLSFIGFIHVDDLIHIVDQCLVLSANLQLLGKIQCPI